MSDHCEKLKPVFSEILQCVMSMSADVIKKSDIHLKDVETLDLLSVETVSQKIKTLLERMNINLTEFVNRLDTAVNEYKSAKATDDSNADISSKGKLKLSLRKNGETQEADIDLTSDSEEILPTGNCRRILDEYDSENCKEEKGGFKMESDKPSDANNKKENFTKEDKNDDLSDTDSERTIPSGCFDVRVPNGSDGDSDEISKDLTRALEELDKMNPLLDVSMEQGRHIRESMSFDFDEVDEKSLVFQLEELQTKEDAREQVQRDNYELLDLLNKAMDNSDDPDAVPSKENNSGEARDPNCVVTEEDADLILRTLKEETSGSSYFDSDDSLSPISDLESDEEWKPPKAVRQGGESEGEGTFSDTENMADDEQENLVDQCKSLKIVIKGRVDHLSDSEIDRLCNLNNINKRKCTLELKKSRKNRPKRIRLLSSSSFSSSSSSSSSSSTSSLPSDATTPDIIVDTERPPSSQSLDAGDVIADLADEFADKLDKEDQESSSDSSTDSEPEEEDKRKEKPEPDKKEEEKLPEIHEVEEDEVIKIDDEPEEKVDEKSEKKVKKDDSLFYMKLWSSSDTDSDRTTPKKADTDVIKRTDVSAVKRLQTKFLDNEEAMVITDSSDSSSDSDDVTFVDEIHTEEVARSTGRRNIRAIMSDDELNEMTQRAKSEEDERIKRLDQHSKTMESIQSQHEDFVLDFDVKTGKPLIVVNHNLANLLKPHQREGVEFMWEACYESVEMLKKKPGTGCILAHCMGLGKTLQVITLIHTLFAHPVTQTKHVLVLCPLSTVINWKNEFNKTFQHLDGRTDGVDRYFLVRGDLGERMQTIRIWRRQGGVMVMGYESFRCITKDHDERSKYSAQEINQTLEALIDPGPDLIVCDEGHQLKDGKTQKTIAVMKIKTQRRIVLSGTPLQNNLKEYYVMVQFVKPHLLGTEAEYMNRFVSPIMNGQYHDSSLEDIKIMKKRTHVLTKLLKKTIHRVEAGVLASYLPELTDHALFVMLTPVQMRLYRNYIDMVTSQNQNLIAMFFQDVRITNFINLHPYTLQLFYSKPRTKKKKTKTRKEDEVINEDEQDEIVINHVRDDWYKNLLPEDAATNINYSAKLKLVMDIINEAARSREKVLIFAQHLVELDVLEHFLKLIKTTQNGTWTRNVDYFRMDGDTPIESRDQWCNEFNTRPRAKIFLLTHRVGGLGLNLTAANRVILIGSNHNPSHDTQSLFRVYRFGQEKNCYAYRMLALGTIEEKIYRRCVFKQSVSKTVVDKMHISRHFKPADLHEIYKYEFDDYGERPIPTVPSDKLLATLLQNSKDIYKYHLHNALLENRPEEELTDEDKNLAWDEFNNLEEAARNIAPVMVLNPLNNNTRGFLPRANLQNGTRPNILKNTARPQITNQNPNVQDNPFMWGLNPKQSQTSGYNQNRPVGNQNATLGNQNNPAGNQNHMTGNQNNSAGNQNQMTGNQNNPAGNLNLGNQSHMTGNQSNPAGNPNRTLGNLNHMTGNQNNPTGNQNRIFGNQNRPVGNQNNPEGNQNRTFGNPYHMIGKQNRHVGNQSRFGNHHNPASNQNRSVGNNGTVEKLVTVVPSTQRLQNFAKALRDREVPVADEAPPTGEFNYALNKIV